MFVSNKKEKYNKNYGKRILFSDIKCIILRPIFIKMNKMNLLFVIFLVFATFALSTPIRCQDPLSGVKSCQGNYPNEITTFITTPDPLVAGQEASVRIAGKATVTIEKGALYKVTGSYNNQQIFQREIDFCEAIVAPGGFNCPVTGDFDFTTKYTEETSPNDPKNTLIDYDVKIISKFFFIMLQVDFVSLC